MQVGSRNVAFRLVLFTIPASFWMGSTNFSLHCCYWRLWAWSCTKPFVKADWFGSCLFGLFGSCINYAISGIFHLENRRENHVKSTQHVRWKVHYVYFVVVKLNMIEASHSYRYMCIYIYVYIYVMKVYEKRFLKTSWPLLKTHGHWSHFYWEFLIKSGWNLMEPFNYRTSPFFIGKFRNSMVISMVMLNY